MENPDTLVLNLTFLGTVGVALMMFFVLFLLGVLTLVLAGVGRLAAMLLMGLFGRRQRQDGIPLVQLYGTRLSARKEASGSAPAGAEQHVPRTAPGPGRLLSALRTAVERHPKLAARREQPVLAEDWASAVAEADARAMARARAAAPDIKLSVRDLPEPGVPAERLQSVAPLVESALHNHRPVHEVPHAFKKPQPPQVLPSLDTGSLVSLTGAQQVLKHGKDQQSAAAETAPGKRG